MSEPEQVQAPAQDLITALSERLDGVEGAPNKDQLLQWKKQYGGNLNVFPMSDDEFYIFRPLNRKEYRQLQSLPDVLKTSTPGASSADLDDKFKDEVCMMAVLYPSKEELSGKLEFVGGLASMLSDQILYASCLVPSEIAISNIRKL